MSAFKLRRKANNKGSSDRERLVQDVKDILTSKKESVVRVIVITAPMESVVPFLAGAEKPSKEIEELEKDVEGLEVHEITVLPEASLEGRTMNIQRDAGK